MLPPRSSTLVRAGCALIAAQSALLGIWEAAAPKHFFAHFPGGGHAWVAVDGAYNEHLVRDVGQGTLVVAILFLAAAWLGAPVLVRAACAAVILPNALHLTYHLAHLGAYKTSDQVGLVVALGMTIVLPLAVLLVDLRAPAPGATPWHTPA